MCVCVCVCVRETVRRRGNTQFVVLTAEVLKSAKTFCFRRVLLPLTAAFTAHSPVTAERDAGECTAAVIGSLHLLRLTHTHTHAHIQVTGKQNCQNDKTTLFRESADSQSSSPTLRAGLMLQSEDVMKYSAMLVN